MQVFATAIDCSYAGSTMDYGAVRRSGYSLVARYLGDDPRCLTPAERDRIYAAGLRLAVIGQRGAVDRPRGGYAAGRADGAFFEDWANRMGWPPHKPILCALADVGAGFPTTSDLPAIDQFLQGLWETISRPVGIYGPYWVLEHFRGDRRVFCYWESAGGSGSAVGTGGQAHNAGDGSYRALSSLACMYQEYGGVAITGTDHNQVLVADATDFTYHPSDIDGPTPEEAIMTKVVFCPNQTGATGWLPQLINGKRYREGYGDPTDLVADGGIVDGSVELLGDAGARFLARYTEGLPYTGPILAKPKPASSWATEVAKLEPGAQPYFLLYPSGLIVRVLDDHQGDTDRFVGIVDRGEIDDAWFYNGALAPWAIEAVELDLSHVDLSTLKVGLTDGAVSLVADSFARRLAE
jgi:Domain of unknown function (DUF1906)